MSVSSTDTSRSKGRPFVTAQTCRYMAVTCATARPYFTAAFTSVPSSICTAWPSTSNARPARRARMEAGLSSSRSHGRASHASRSAAGSRGVGVAIHVLAGIQREHREAGGGARRDVLGRLEMIRVGALPRRPSRLEAAPGRVVDHRLGRSRGARHLPDRLLGEDGRDGAAGGDQAPAHDRAWRGRGDRRSRRTSRAAAAAGRATAGGAGGRRHSAP